MIACNGRCGRHYPTSQAEPLFKHKIEWACISGALLVVAGVILAVA